MFCTVSGVGSPKNGEKQDGMLAFFCIFFSTLFGMYGVETSPKSGPKALKKRQKWRPGVVLGTLGGAPGGIWAPTRPKAQKSSKKGVRRPPPRDPQGDPKIFRNPSKYPKRARKTHLESTPGKRVKLGDFWTLLNLEKVNISREWHSFSLFHQIHQKSPKCFQNGFKTLILATSWRPVGSKGGF